MAPQAYGLYDRVLDWFSEHRMVLAKGFVVFAVFAIIASLLLAILAQL